MGWKKNWVGVGIGVPHAFCTYIQDGASEWVWGPEQPNGPR